MSALSPRNRIVVFRLSQDELETLKKFYIKLSKLAEKDNDLFSSHSVDEADHVHREKTSYHHKRRESHVQK